MLDPPQQETQPHYPEGRHHHNQIIASSYGSQTDQDLQLQDQIIQRIAQRHPNAGVLMHSSRKVNWIQSISFDELKYLLKISENDLKQTELTLTAEIKKREEAENLAKRARYNTQREKALNAKLQKQNDDLKEILQSKEMALSKCLSQNLKLKDTISHSLQLFKIFAQQSKKILRKQEIVRAKKLQQLGEKAVQNIQIVKAKVWDPEKIKLFQREEGNDDEQEQKQLEDWGMIDEFLLNNGEYRIDETTQNDDNFVLSLSQNQDIKQLTGNSQELLLTSLGKRAREIDSNQNGNIKILEQSPSMTDTFSKLRQEEKGRQNTEVIHIQNSNRRQQLASAASNQNQIHFFQEQQQLYQQQQEEEEEEEEQSDGNLNESDIIVEQTPKATRVIQSSGVSASHSFKPLAEADSGHINSDSKQIHLLTTQTEEIKQREQEKLMELKLSTQFSPPKQQFFNSESPDLLNHIAHSLGTNQVITEQNQNQRKRAAQSAFFPTSPQIFNKNNNFKMSVEGSGPLHTSGDDSAAVIFAGHSQSTPVIKRHLELKLNNQITASAELKSKQQQLEALQRQNSLTKDTIALTLELERERLKKQFVKEYERLKQGNNQLKRSLKDSKKEYEKQLKSLLAQIKQKNQNIARVEKENNQVRKDHKSSRSAIKRVENSSSILQKQQDDLKKENLQRNKDIQQARQQNEQMSIQNERLRQKLREARQQFSKLSTQMLNFGSDKELKTPNLIAEVIDLRKKLEIENESKQSISNKLDQQLVSAQRQAKNLRERIIQLMSERSKMENQVVFLKNKQTEMLEESHLKDVKINQCEVKLEVRVIFEAKYQESSQNEQNMNKKLAKRIEMLKQVQQTNDHLSQTIRTLKKQAQEAAKAKAKAQNDLYTAQKQKTQYGLSLERLQEQLQQIEHEKAHLSALVQSQRKEHKQAGPLSTAVKQLSLIILNKTRKASDMKPQEKNLIKQVFDANIQSLLSECEDNLTKSKANQRLLAQSLKTHVTNSTSYLSDISGMALSIQKLGKVLQRFGATDLPVEVALLRDEIVQQRAEMRSKAAFAEQQIKDLEREFKVLSTGMLVDHMDLGNVRDQENQGNSKMVGNNQTMQQQLKELLAKNEGGGPALLSENKKLMSQVDRLMKQNERLNGELVKLMQRQKQHQIARYQQEIEYMKSQIGEFQNLNKVLTKKLQSAMASNQDLKILVAKMDNQRSPEQLYDSEKKSIARSKTKSDRSVGFFPADNMDANQDSPIRGELGRPLQDSLGRISPRSKQLDLSKQLNEASILQLNVSQGLSLGINESDNELLSLLHCQCSALQEIIQRKRNASPKPVQSP